MVNLQLLALPDVTPGYPVLRKVRPAELKDALTKGVNNFLPILDFLAAAPLFAVVFSIMCRRLQSSDAVLAISASILLTISETGIREMLTIFDPVLAIIAACSQSSAPAHAICN